MSKTFTVTVKSKEHGLENIIATHHSDSLKEAVKYLTVMSDLFHHVDGDDTIKYTITLEER